MRQEQRRHTNAHSPFLNASGVHMPGTRQMEDRMRRTLSGIAFVVVGLLSLAGEPLVSGLAVARADNGNVTIESQSGSKPYQPGVRPQRYFCVIEPPDSADTSMMYSCPASPGRVGGRCRCPNTVGSGTLYAR